jgi:hypothetical protein
MLKDSKGGLLPEDQLQSFPQLLTVTTTYLHLLQ